MSIAECMNFLKHAEGRDLISNDTRIAIIMRKDSDNDGILTLEDFFDYFRSELRFGLSHYR